MKRRTKDRAKKVALIVIFLIIIALITSLFLGRTKTENVVYVAKEGIELGKPLEQQLEFFDVMEISKDEYSKFKGQVAKSLSQLNGQMVLYEMSVGTPVTKSALTKYTDGGVFAAKMPKGRTVHLMVGATVGLPPVEKGDKVNVILVYKEKNAEENEEPVISMLMENVTVYNLTETDLYLDVTVEESLVLSQAAQMGTFVYQVPGVDGKSKGALKDVDFKRTVKVSDLLKSIQTGEYYSENRVTAEKILKDAAQKLEQFNATGDEQQAVTGEVTTDGSVN